MSREYHCTVCGVWVNPVKMMPVYRSELKRMCSDCGRADYQADRICLAIQTLTETLSDVAVLISTPEEDNKVGVSIYRDAEPPMPSLLEDDPPEA